MGLLIRDDSIWSWNLIFSAKKNLRVPNAVYIWRNVKSSITRIKKTPQQTINFWVNPAILGLKTLDKLMSKHEFFQQNQQYRYAILESFINSKVWAFLNNSFQLPPFAVYETIKQEFGDRLGEQYVLVSALCTLLNTQQRINAVNVQKFNQFVAQAQKRIAELEAQLKIK